MFVEQILWRPLYWNSLNFVFNVILKGKENILSQSSSNVLVLNISLYFFMEVGLDEILEENVSYNSFD